LATAVAGQRLGVNPFDQPNVESAKVLARHMTAQYAARGELPAETPAFVADGVRVYGETQAGGPIGALDAFLAQGRPGDYVALQAYIQPTPAHDAALAGLRRRIFQRTGLAVTVGYGPRFLHSTGQLHKGDAGNGLFIQITAEPACDAPIPDEMGAPASSMSFGVLIAAQALGDLGALREAGRRVIRFHIEGDVAEALGQLY